MRGFVFIKYDGDDAGDVLDKILTDGPGGGGLDDDDVHDVTSKTYRRIGFVPNDPEPETEEPEEEEPDEDNGTITH